MSPLTLSQALKYNLLQVDWIIKKSLMPPWIFPPWILPIDYIYV